jgi:hypothetical protein
MLTARQPNGNDQPAPPGNSSGLGDARGRPPHGSSRSSFSMAAAFVFQGFIAKASS